MRNTALRSGHVWSTDEVSAAANLWRDGLSQDNIAQAMTARMGLLVSRKAIARMADAHPSQFPSRRQQVRKNRPASNWQPSEKQQAIAARVEKIVELWALNVAPAIIAERAGCQVSYVTEFVRNNADRCPPRTAETMPKGVLPVRDLSEFGIGKCTKWVRANVPLATIDVPGKTPVSVAGFSWDAQT